MCCLGCFSPRPRKIERAGIDHEKRLDALLKTLYCPWHIDGGYHSHIHAAYTGLAWDALEETGHFPIFGAKVCPFQRRQTITQSTRPSMQPARTIGPCFPAMDRPLRLTVLLLASSEINSIPNTTTKRSGKPFAFAHACWLLFEQIGKPRIEEGELAWSYPLKPLSPENIFPKAVATCTARQCFRKKAEYHELWVALLEGLKLIPQSHVANLPLWLDHFDSLWLTDDTRNSSCDGFWCQAGCFALRP